MKTFFYTVTSPRCAENCNFNTCSKRYFNKLQAQKYGGEYYALEGPITFGIQSVSGFPQHGDIVVLFVQNSEELCLMNSSSECFEGMKKLLVVADASGIDGTMFHKLSPRYITQASRTVEELGQVIEKMKIPINSMS
ncbi:hypothetical protein [Desulforhopalus sp. 52FAK]